MKRKRFSEEQIIKALKRFEAGEKPKELCRELGIHERLRFMDGSENLAAWKCQRLNAFASLRMRIENLKRWLLSKPWTSDCLRI
tara:strand:- start:1020 stop:1271 length:252 start_codon:yes stop_codon:yes gene_type:complete